MKQNINKIKIFNDEKSKQVEEDFEKFFSDENKTIIDFRYSSTGHGGYNRDCVCVYYSETLN